MLEKKRSAAHTRMCTTLKTVCVRDTFYTSGLSLHSCGLKPASQNGKYNKPLASSSAVFDVLIARKVKTTVANRSYCWGVFLSSSRKVHGFHGDCQLDQLDALGFLFAFICFLLQLKRKSVFPVNFLLVTRQLDQREHGNSAPFTGLGMGHSNTHLTRFTCYCTLC